MRTPIDVPVSLWLEIATYCTSPVDLLVLARVCQTARTAAQADVLWDRFTPVEVEKDLYHCFVDRMANCSPDAIKYFLDFWHAPYNPRVSMIFPPDCPVDNIDIALAAARGIMRPGARACPSRIMFEQFCRNSFFAHQAILLNPLFYRVVKEYNSNPEHARLALSLNPDIWQDIPVVLRSTDEEIISRGLRSSWVDLCYVYNKAHPCRDVELICLRARRKIRARQQFWDAIDPGVHSKEFYEKLAENGFPVWEFVPELQNKSFLLQHCRCPYDIFLDDKEFNLEMIQTGRRPCRISSRLENDPDFLAKVLPSYLKIVWDLNPNVVCSPLFKNLLYNYSFEGVDQIDEVGTFPDCLQDRNLALKAVERNGAWICCFDHYTSDKEVLKVAVRTFPEALSYSGVVWEAEDLVEFCDVNPQVVWYTGKKFHETHPRYMIQSVDSAAPAGPLDCFWFDWEENREDALLAARKHEDNIKIIAKGYRNWFRDKELVLAALEVAPGSLLWELSPDLLDDVEIWDKARAKRMVPVITA